MASDATTSFRSTKETTNYARLCRLLVDVGSQVLRTTLDKIHRPENLGTFLSRKPIHSVLLSLRKKQVLNAHQWEKLYPQSLVSSQNFDITLLTVLLKNIFLVPPTCGWDRPPPTENIAPEADIVRITLYRDTVYSYATRAAVDDKTFKIYWKDITDVLVRLGGACYQNAINRIKTECMTSDFEKYYRELLRNWYQDDDTIEEREDRALEDLVAMFGGLYISERVEAFEKFSHPPMRSSDSFPAKHTQLRPFKEARRKTISSFYNGERRRRPKHSVNIKGNGCCNLHRPSDLEKGAVFSTFSDHVSPNGSINGSFRKDQSTSDATLILKATDEFDESCKLESDNLNGPDERVKPSLHCSSRAIKDGRKRKQRMVSCDETSFTSIYQGGYVVDTQEESTLSNETTEEAERQLMATPVEESPRPVCGHYQRRCLTLFPCCGKFFPCHRCHNESDCTEDRATAVNATHIRCTICYNEQVIDENSQRCGSCNSKMSEYFCATCKHFTSFDKNPFHCTKCRICRIHGDRSFHCDVCNVCVEKRLEGKHMCRPDSGHDECCICLEDAFSGCQILPCSHKVHKDCAIEMIQNGVRTCPICRHPLFGQLHTSPQ